ncbi:hypothetical protein PENSOL_c056G04982 [Penicillium solitum]|uniref:HNH nuclease domain-containing protein n=1 Tax=Penicillium solitum TaxID=60172 RepID=A0A1V6QQH5_9EURO|nr:uncharacterized protein PENSOL_c056G04982 [Penicillium solitum]OQD91247.1 hypothetical protein PENSOL_c056G04982 [Penicillium solitum]
MIVRASSIKIVSTAMGIATKDPDDENWDSSQQDKFLSDLQPATFTSTTMSKHCACVGKISSEEGRYLPRNMLFVLVEEMGHEYNFMLDGVTCSPPDDDNLLLGLLSRNFKARPSISVPGIFGDSASEDEDSDDG